MCMYVYGRVCMLESRSGEIMAEPLAGDRFTRTLGVVKTHYNMGDFRPIWER